MDNRLCFARTEKGREELLGGGRTLKPRQRQVLFLVGETISVQNLKDKLPTCLDLENILDQLWEGGFIGQVKSAQVAPTPSVVPAKPPLEAARELALRILASLVGDRSPVYTQVAQAQDDAALLEAVIAGRKTLAAVASAQQAAAFWEKVTGLLGYAPVNGKANGIAMAKGRALEIICSLVGDRSPVFAKISGADNRSDFIDAVNSGKKVIAAVASASHAHHFETEVLGLIEDH